MPGTTDDARWLPAGEEAVVTAETPESSGETLWQGTVELRSPPAPGRHRLLIEELEHHAGLSSDGAPFPTERVVFIETIEV